MENPVLTGIGSSDYVIDFPASAGPVTVTVKADLSILDGAQIVSGKSGAGNAGPIKVTAARMLIDEKTSPDFTGINSLVHTGTGSGAAMEVAVAGELKILNGGAISAATFAEGNAGPVKVTAASIYIDEQTSPFGTGIFSSAQFDSSGNAGDIEVSSKGPLSMIHGGSIGAFTQSVGAAGSIS